MTELTAGNRSLEDPTLPQARAWLSEGIHSAQLVTAFGRCTVEYEGRAASSLGPGQRQLMLKPDGTTLLHTAEGQQPVNWLPPGCKQRCSLAADTLVVEAVDEAEDQQLTIQFEQIGLVTAVSMTDTATLEVSGTEAALKERILETPAIIEAGFRPLATERETPAGPVDIYGEAADGTTVIVELKRRRVGPDAVGQLDRYVTALATTLHDDADLRGILAAPSVTDRGRTLLAKKGLEFVSVEPLPGQ